MPSVRLRRPRLERRDGYVLWTGGPVPKGMAGITLGSLVIVRDGCVSERLIRHELVHVRQWRRHGVFGFGARYLGHYLLWRVRRKGHHGAYLRIPMEIEAEWVARRSLATAVRDDWQGADVKGLR
ncbi:MAG: hypothetical protein RLZ04_2380 [Actinomycetota bacterium]|jgi:hypothetical protein